MGNLIVISGPNGSGKSLYAEKVTAVAGENRIYIATMIPQTEENQTRIQKHIRQRAGWGFRTLELPYCVGHADAAADSVVLLEDVSNLLANAIFEKGGDAEAVFADICRLQSRTKTLVAVTIDDLNPDGFEGETAAYIHQLNRLNERLKDRADTAVSMKDGVPFARKGGLPDVD